MKKLSVFLINLIVFNFCFSQYVNEEEAYKVAKNCYFERLKNFSPTDTFLLNPEPIKLYDNNNEVVIYVFERLDKEGFIMISAEKSVFPILGYSFESYFETNYNPPPAFLSMIEQRKKEISLVRKNPDLKKSNAFEEWTKYNMEYFEPEKEIKSVFPLLSTKWGQGCYYNEMCPADPQGPCGHVVTGCVATAMGQIMKFHNYPQNGQGANMYVHPTYGNLHVNFANSTYYWEQMESQLSSSNLYVAELLYHLGVSVFMDYAPDGSGASSQNAEYSLINFFKYANYLKLHEKNWYTDDSWSELLRVELNSKRPIYYHGFGSAGGHAFVCDGYQGNNHFHINWGWDGAYDGYFYLHNLGGFTSDQGAIFGIEPAECDQQYCQSFTLLTQPAGIITDDSEDKRYGNNTSCKWLIQVENAQSITIKFNKLNTEDYIDVVCIYQGDVEHGTLISTVSGAQLPQQPIVISGNTALIWFFTNETNRAEGWEIEYSSLTNIYSYYKEKISLLSNLTSDVLTIKFENAQFLNCKCKILSIDGKVIFEKQYSKLDYSNSIDINISSFSKGMYILSIDIDNLGFFWNQKFVIY